MTEADRTRATVAAFGTCTVLRNPTAVKRVLSMPPLAEMTAHQLSMLANSDCLRSGELRMAPDLMRGALYQSLYRTEYPRALAEFAPTPVDYWAEVGGSLTAGSNAKQYVGLRQFGDCVVRSDPENSRKVVLAPVASKVESQAFAALMPKFGACLAAGQTIAFTKPLLTSVLAETLYRESRMSAPAPAETRN